LPVKLKVKANLTLKPSFNSNSAWYPSILLFKLYDKDVSEYPVNLSANGVRVESAIGIQGTLELLMSRFRAVDSLSFYIKDKEIESLKNKIESLETELKEYEESDEDQATNG
jgi:hypothetical protein